MRKYLVVPVLGACLLALAGPPTLASGSPALAGSTTHYSGKNSQGLTIEFSVAQTASGPEFVPGLIVQIVRCPVTGVATKVGDEFRGFHTPIRNGKFSFGLNGSGVLLSWSGTVTATEASGMESIHMAGFDNEGGLQDCNEGSLPWTAQSVASGSAAVAAPNAAYLVKTTKTPDGSVHYSITH